ncbi:MAG: cyclodeaminase/cyclohydrolase family protein [Phycisphaerales bacterium]|nr:cyclodeaminase/cyclohydrolase family protein [Phycisphaerales bacterium]
MTLDLSTMTVSELLEALSDRKPVPGGGAAAGAVAAIGIATGRMVLSYSIGKDELAQHDAVNQAAAEELDQWRQEALHLAQADAEAFEVLQALWKLSAEDQVRIEGWHDAVMGAIAAPLATCELCRRSAELLSTLPARTNPLLHSDLYVGATLLVAACDAAACNVRVNLPTLEDELERARLAGQAADDVERCREYLLAIEVACGC